MHPQQLQPPLMEPAQDGKKPTPRGGDPTKASRSLAIALVVSCIFLLAAAGIVVWMVFSSNSPTAVVNIAPDDTKNVKNVSWVIPATLPPQYIKSDQSTVNATNIYYYDDAINCGITTGVIAVTDQKSLKELVVDFVAATQTQGVTVAATTEGESYAVGDADGEKTYTFNSINLDQDLNVQGLNFTKQSNNVAYKQFGQQAALIGYACKAETWAEKKPELAELVKTFIVKTER